MISITVAVFFSINRLGLILFPTEAQAGKSYMFPVHTEVNTLCQSDPSAATRSRLSLIGNNLLANRYVPCCMQMSIRGLYVLAVSFRKF